MKLVIPCRDEIHIVRHEEILYCHSQNSYTAIILTNGEKFVISKPLSRLAMELNSGMFIKVSQSYLVNMNQVNKIDKRNKIIEFFGSKRIQFTIKIKTLVDFLMNMNEIRSNDGDFYKINPKERIVA